MGVDFVKSWQVLYMIIKFVVGSLVSLLECDKLWIVLNMHKTSIARLGWFIMIEVYRGIPGWNMMTPLSMMWILHAWRGFIVENLKQDWPWSQT